MLTVKLDLLYDAGIPLWAFLFGDAYAVLTYFFVVLIEAKIMRKHFQRLDRKKLISYSLIVNTVSTILGLLLIFLLGMRDYTPKTLFEFIYGIAAIVSVFTIPPIFIALYSKWLLVAFVITIVSEFTCMVYLMRPKQYMTLLRPRQMKLEILKFTLHLNVVSYVAMTFIPIIFLGIIIILNVIQSN